VSAAPAEVATLVERFDRNIADYKAPAYNETQARREFIDPFFKALGWDIDNERGYAEAYKDVIHEDAIKVGGATKAPDYCFRIGGARKFFLEAKKPAVPLKDHAESAFQLRRYAWSARLPLSILTDFEELAVYDCRVRPHKNDKSATARTLYFTYDAYLDRWDDLASVFSRDAVLKGSFDRYAESGRRKRGTAEVDVEFLKAIEGWRDALAKNFALRNPRLADRELNFAVQRTIDRVIFLRMCEDRGIEQYGALQALCAGPKIYARLARLFRQADDRYNSSLFYFTPETGREPPDELTLALELDDKPLREILRGLYYPESPYEFSVLPPEILGQVYEQFLGKVIRLTTGHRAKVEKKPEVRKAGGVYYTPTYIVDYIVKHTVGRLLEGKTPPQVGPDPKPSPKRKRGAKPSRARQEAEGDTSKRRPVRGNTRPLRILDPACGSGSFLLGAYQYLLDWHRDGYVDDGPENHTDRIYQGPGAQWRLTIAEKKRILLNNIYGVDIDAQAVEVTKLSLLLKVLEGESAETIGHTLRLFHERALPDLGHNIKCGNSLIGPDFYDNQQLDLLDDDQRYRINAFDWQAEFPDAFTAQNPGFDAVIGNPPYLKEANNRELFALIRASRTSRYCIGKMDLWYAFACVALDILQAGGIHAFIATNNWITNHGARLLREKIMRETRILRYVDFGDFKVFREASIQTMVYILQKEPQLDAYRTEYLKIPAPPPGEPQVVEVLQKSTALPDLAFAPARIYPARQASPFTFCHEHTQNVLETLTKRPCRRFHADEIGNGIDVLQDFVTARHLETLRDPSLRVGDGIFVVTPAERATIATTTEDHSVFKPYYTTTQLGRYRADAQNHYWIIYADQKVRSNIERYAGIREHLDRFCPVLTSVYAPYGLHRPREEHLFLGTKILSLRKTRVPAFSLVDFPCYVSRAFLILRPGEWGESPLYLLAILNSRVIHFWLSVRGKKQGDQLQVDKQPLLDIPIRTLDLADPAQETLHNGIAAHARQMLDLHQQLSAARTPTDKTAIQRQITATDNQIDRLVYQLYGLSDEEVRLVEDATSDKI